MTEFRPQPGWLPGPWLSEKITQVMKDAMVRKGDVQIVSSDLGTVIAVPLGGLATDKNTEEDITCDKCNKVFLKGLWAFAMTLPTPFPGVTLMVGGGFCDTCADEENVERRQRMT